MILAFTVPLQNLRSQGHPLRRHLDLGGGGGGGGGGGKKICFIFPLKKIKKIRPHRPKKKKKKKVVYMRGRRREGWGEGGRGEGSLRF